MRGTVARCRIEQVMMTADRVEVHRIAARCCERRQTSEIVPNFDREQGLLWMEWIRYGGAPRSPLRMAALAAQFAEVQQHVFETFRPEQRGDAIGHIALCDAVQGQFHACTAKLNPVTGDVDVAMIFDHFTMAVPLSLEQYGFCGIGEGGPMIESGATTWPDGGLPVNTHGGSNGEAFLHGVNHIPSAVRQIRGTSTSQVDGAEVALVTGAITDPSGAVLLGRDR